MVGANNAMHDHFSRVASTYREIRTTDIEPVSLISGALSGFDDIKIADIGCGGGRYDLLLFQQIDGLHLTCVEANQSMLEQAVQYLTNNDVTNFDAVHATAETLPLEDHSLHGLTTFNAIHHFDFPRFIERALRAIDPELGKMFIYTRTPSQNSGSIWGQLFPSFAERETRLYELDEMEEMIDSVDQVRLETTISFKYERRATLEELIDRVRARHYSTFSLYDDSDLEEATDIFQRNVAFTFDDPSDIAWSDENMLLVLSPGPY
ncbi:MAG: class I SAM-dependent methyltransferase [SAR202 cluster bacterium]|jgi:SAM-dependent methyltransferase|nr:class I SAM-dependent methyltransferase [SAR202 cluster bacterium]|tara:strand:- start:3385 stop:4176 length:792 start_codon:yes stop_codon:yes gene_type:complete